VNVLATYLIGLREGLEAALIVSILVAYLVKTDRREALPFVWAGVAAAAAMSLGVAAILKLTSSALSETAEELFAGIMSFIAVGLVTWMIFWMKSASRTIASDLRNNLDRAFAMGVGAVAAMAFVSVAREGLETAVFFFSLTGSTGAGFAQVLGLVLGLATSAAVGWLLYKGAIRIDLSKFFRYTGLLLILVAAGVLAYGVHELQEVGVLPGEDNLAFDVSGTIPADSWYGSVLRGILGFRPAMSVLEVAAWAAYVGITTWLFLRPGRPRAVAAPAAERSVTA
jgi:high-affinity iron transporter